MKNRKVKLIAGTKTLIKVEIKRGLLQGDALSLFLTHIFRKCSGGFKFTKSQEQINYQIYMVDIQFLTKIKKCVGA